jgi:hypothetical protein
MAGRTTVAGQKFGASLAGWVVACHHGIVA